MKKILLILVLLFLFIPNYLAADAINYYYIDVTVNIDGSMTVKEYYDLAGSYNGSYRDLNYIGSTAPFNGDKKSLEGSSIYNGSGIKDIEVYDTYVEDDHIYLNKQFTPSAYAVNGDYGVYQLVHNDKGIRVKTFNPDTYNTGFYLEYTVDDVVIIHNDVAEIGWNFFSKEFEENINQLKITFHLPATNQNLRGWTHGPLTGEITLVDKYTAEINYNNLPSHTPIDVRLVFDKEIVPYATKRSNMNALNYILEIEQNLANKANKIRQRAKLIIKAVNILTYLWYIGLLVIVIKIYYDHDKELKATFNHQYYREFPAEYGPEIVEYLFKKKITPNAISALLLELIRKKHLKVESVGKKDYDLIKNIDSNEGLTEAEQYLKNWFINEIGNGQFVSLKDLKRASSSYKSSLQFMNAYNKWQDIVIKTGEKEKFFEDHFKIKLKVIQYAILGAIAITLLNVINQTDNALGYISLIPALIAIMYFVSFKKRTVKGNEQYQQWRAFKRFLADFGRFSDKELPEIYLWEKYLVYATVLGVATKLAKTMKIKLENMDTPADFSINYTLLYLNNSLATDLTSTINHSINRTVSSAIANSKTSSGSGFGGGSSFGGGSFGGGGGGGRF
jgi:uncharacterized membrane protein